MARRRSGPVKADDHGTDLLPLVPEEHTGAVAVPRGTEVIGGGGPLPAVRPEDVLAEPPDARDISAELAAPPRRGLPWLTLALSACVVAAGAFIGGVYVEKHHLNGSPSQNPFAAAGSGRTGGAGATAGAGRGFGGTGAGTGTGAGGGLTFGTVKLVDGDTIYLTDAQGNTVKVTTTGSTKVTESRAGKVADLKAGQTVTVRGTADSSGNVAATTVTEGATTPGGFGGFGFGQGGPGGTAGAGGAGGTGGGN
ncbi:hypothetical protein [Streptomyces sp. NPDC020983]|uniref:hypothetical protein n=1 Tax=Streptomyces sp. NPDC020983 TaxID=3365106 RepID=UPI003798D579